MCIQFILGEAITSVKGQEHTLNETSLVLVGLLFKFTTVELRGPNKTLNLKKKKILMSNIPNNIHC